MDTKTVVPDPKAQPEKYQESAEEAYVSFSSSNVKSTEIGNGDVPALGNKDTVKG